MKKTFAIHCLSALAFIPAAFSAPVGTLSVHVLNQQTGIPSADVTVILEKQTGSDWQKLATEKTDDNGRIKSLYPLQDDMQPGIYKVTFETGNYFKQHQQDSFFPEIPVIFKVTKTNEKLHIPLLLSQYGYASYRGN